MLYEVITNVAGDQKSIKNKIGARLFALFFSKMIIDKRRELKILEKSQVDWTLVRLPFVREGKEKGEIKENELDMPGRITSYNVCYTKLLRWGGLFSRAPWAVLFSVLSSVSFRR